MSRDQGGYRHCACRDCGQVTMTTGLPEHEFCRDCRDTCDRESECSSGTAHTYCDSEEEHWQAASEGAPIFSGSGALKGNAACGMV